MGALLGGFALSHGSRKIKLGPLSVSAKSLQWTASIDGEKMIYGTSKVPQGRTAGVFKPESVSFEVYKGDAPLVDAFLLGASKGQGILMASFPIVVASNELAAGTPQFDTITGARVTKLEESGSEGGDAVTVKYSGSFMNILLSGKPLVFELPF